MSESMPHSHSRPDRGRAQAAGVAAGGLLLILGFLVGRWDVGGKTVPASREAAAPPGPNRKVAAAEESAQRSVDRRIPASSSPQRSVLTAPSAAFAPPNPITLDPLREGQMRTILANLRELASARDQFRLVNNRDPQFDDLVGPGRSLPELNPVDGEDYRQAFSGTRAPRILHVVTDHGLSIMMGVASNDPQVSLWPEELVRISRARAQTAPAFNVAMDAYRTAHGGKFPPDANAIVPYFADTSVAADFVEWRESEKRLVPQIRQVRPAGPP
jgi:hypothetical protein